MFWILNAIIPINPCVRYARFWTSMYSNSIHLYNHKYSNIIQHPSSKSSNLYIFCDIPKMSVSLGLPGDLRLLTTNPPQQLWGSEVRHLGWRVPLGNTGDLDDDNCANITKSRIYNCWMMLDLHFDVSIFLIHPLLVLKNMFPKLGQIETQIRIQFSTILRQSRLLLVANNRVVANLSFTEHRPKFGRHSPKNRRWKSDSPFALHGTPVACDGTTSWSCKMSFHDQQRKYMWKSTKKNILSKLFKIQKYV